MQDPYTFEECCGVTICMCSQSIQELSGDFRKSTTENC